MSAPAPADLTLVSITKRYGATTAVDRVSLEVAAGEFLTLLGPSGCGKTTLLKSVAGFLALDEGEVVLRGRVITDELPHLRNIGIVFQNYALFPHMTAAENIAFGLKMRKVPRLPTRRRVEEMLELVKLPGFSRRYPHELSGGQQQRVALARVLAVQPELLLLDEPFGALDRKLRIEMQIEVKQLIMALGITTLFVTHDQEEAMRMSDRVAVMNAGRIIQCDVPAAVYDHPGDLFVADFIGASNRLPAKVLDGGCLEVAGAIVRTAAPLSGLAGPEAVLVIRPENLSLTAEACPDRPAWRGRVTFALQAGPIMEYEVELETGARVRVTEPRTRDKRAWGIGAEVSVAIADPGLCRVYASR